MPSYYDMVISTLGLLILAGMVGYALVGSVGIVTASVLSFVVLYHSLFVRPPTKTTTANAVTD